LYISILAEEAKIAAPYPAPDEAEIHRTFEEMGMDYEELKATRHMTPAPKIRTT
jgi:hypothetical protein